MSRARKAGLARRFADALVRVAQKQPFCVAEAYLGYIVFNRGLEHYLKKLSQPVWRNAYCVGKLFGEQSALVVHIDYIYHGSQLFFLAACLIAVVGGYAGKYYELIEQH